MARLNWSLATEDTLVATGDDTGAEFRIKAPATEDGEYVMSVAGHPITYRGQYLLELMLEAEGMDREPTDDMYRDIGPSFIGRTLSEAGR